MRSTAKRFEGQTARESRAHHGHRSAYMHNLRPRDCFGSVPTIVNISWQVYHTIRPAHANSGGRSPHRDVRSLPRIRTFGSVFEPKTPAQTAPRTQVETSTSRYTYAAHYYIHCQRIERSSPFAQLSSHTQPSHQAVLKGPRTSTTAYARTSSA